MFLHMIGGREQSLGLGCLSHVLTFAGKKLSGYRPENLYLQPAGGSTLRGLSRLQLFPPREALHQLSFDLRVALLQRLHTRGLIAV